MLSVKVLVLCFVALGMISAGAAQAANPVVVIETSLGTIKVELFEDKAPGTVKNFLSYVDDKHYDGLIFHRVMEGFMVQGGGMEPGGKQRTTKEPIKNEAANGLSNIRGTIAMARLPAADSATSQFYINIVDNTMLDKKSDPNKIGYCVFGRVTEGMDVVDKIVKVEKTVDAQGDLSVPKVDVVIKSARRAEAKK